MMDGEPAYLARTRAAYDTVAARYAVLVPPRFDDVPFDPAMLRAFAELVKAGPGGTVADVGCGPGHVTERLASLGLDVFGIDLSPATVAVARDRHPGLRFEDGTMTALDLPSDALAGVVAWYSIIHIPPTERPAVLAEFARVLQPGGLLMLAFQVGDEVRHLTRGYGFEIDLDSHRLRPEVVEAELTGTGFDVAATLLRAPMTDETAPQAVIIARYSPPQPAHP
jgi:SAM-dependent methyltransferase